MKIAIPVLMILGTIGIYGLVLTFKSMFGSLFQIMHEVPIGSSEELARTTMAQQHGYACSRSGPDASQSVYALNCVMTDHSTGFGKITPRIVTFGLSKGSVSGINANY